MNHDRLLLWKPCPEELAAAPLTHFGHAAARRAGRDLADYDALHAWSIQEPAAFWDHCLGLLRRHWSKGREGSYRPRSHAKSAFLPHAKLSFSENLLRRADETPAIIFRGEDGSARRLSWLNLHSLVSRLQQALTLAVVSFVPEIEWPAFCRTCLKRWLRCLQRPR